MESQIKFSIIVPVYKACHLKDCIDSILGQTYTNLELVLVNDGSPENIDAIVSSYNDSRIKYRARERNMGLMNLVDNWNDCLKDATGDYVINMGDDDMLLPNCLADYVILIQNHPGLSVYHMRSLFIDDQGNIVRVQSAAPEWESALSLVWHVWNGRWTMLGDFCYSLSALRQSGGFYNLPLAWHADHITSFEMASQGGVANTYTPGFLFRLGKKSISGRSELAEMKLAVWPKVKVWYQNFLKTEPTDMLDHALWSELDKDLDGFIHRSMVKDMGEDVLANHHRWWYYWTKRKTFGFGLIDMINVAVFQIVLPQLKKQQRI